MFIRAAQGEEETSPVEFGKSIFFRAVCTLNMENYYVEYVLMLIIKLLREIRGIFGNK